MKEIKSINKWKNEDKTIIVLAVRRMIVPRSKWQWSSQKKKHKTTWLDRKWNMATSRNIRLWMRLMVLKWLWNYLRDIQMRHRLQNNQISKTWWWTQKASSKYWKWVSRRSRRDSRSKKPFKQMRTSCSWEAYSNLKRQARKNNSLSNKRKICSSKSLSCRWRRLSSPRINRDRRNCINKYSWKSPRSRQKMRKHWGKKKRKWKLCANSYKKPKDYNNNKNKQPSQRRTIRN